MQNPAVERPPVPLPLALGLAVMAASTSSVLIRYAQQDASSIVIAAYRLAIASVILVPLVVVRYRAELKLLTPRQLRLTLLSGLFLALHFATWITSLEFTSVASSVVLVQTTPLIVALLSPALLKEPVARYLLLGLAVAMLGAVIVGASDACGASGCPEASELLSDTAIKGDALALAGAAAGAAYVMIGRRVRREVSLLPYIGISYGIAAVLLGMGAVLSGQPLGGFEPRTYLWFALLAIFPQLIAHSTYNWALRYLAAAVVSLVLLGEPVASTALAFIALGEIPTLPRIMGGMLILIGIALATGLSRPRIPNS